MQRFFRSIAATALIGCLLLASASARADGPVSLILHNGKVFTANDEQPWVQAVAMHGPLIVAVGSNAHVLGFQTPGTRVIDLQGRTAIPGLNNAHAHAFWASNYPHAKKINVADFVPGPGPTLAEIKTAIAAGAGAHPGGTWLFGTIGTAVQEDPAASRFELDLVSPNHPVILFPWTAHGPLFNTKAMELMGLDEEEADPPHGFYARVGNTNVINGFAHEYAGDLINQYFANLMTDQEFVTLYQAFEADALSKGFTSIQDMSVGLTHSKTLDLLKQSDLSIRWRAICYPMTLAEGCDDRLQFTPYNPFSRLMGSGIKWITDGTPIERLAHVTVEYQDQPGWFGESSFTPTQFNTFMTRALLGLNKKNQTLLHIAGDANWDQLFATMSPLAPDFVWRQRRTRVEHGDLLRPDLYAKTRNKGIVVVQNPSHFGIPEIFGARFKPVVYAYSMPWKSLQDEGIHIAIGTDGIGEVGDPYLDLFLSLIHPIRPSQALGVEDAVSAYTHGSAYAEFQEDWKGTIEPFKLADIAVLSKDIFDDTLPPDEAILGTTSVLTIVGGEIVHDAM